MLIVDRISEGVAVIEDGENRFEVPRQMLSENIREGDVVVLRDDIYVKDENGTDERRKKIIEMQNNLWE
ncbi:MAG: DUF3006 domain-containing protein [Oscillospiraceae bacterium]|nr:DUF3006 domain-containing protein [Oscillospiraceae bacterium]